MTFILISVQYCDIWSFLYIVYSKLSEDRVLKQTVQPNGIDAPM